MLGNRELVGVFVDYQVLFNIALTLAAALGGWVLNTITTNIRELTSNLRKLDEEHRKTREEYVTKADHKSDLDGLNRRFDRIDDKLDVLLTEIAHGNKAA